MCSQIWASQCKAPNLDLGKSNLRKYTDMQMRHLYFGPHGFFLMGGKSWNLAHPLEIGLDQDPHVLTVRKMKAENTYAVGRQMEGRKRKWVTTHILHPPHNLTSQESHTCPKVEKDRKHTPWNSPPGSVLEPHPLQQHFSRCWSQEFQEWELVPFLISSRDVSQNVATSLDGTRKGVKISILFGTIWLLLSWGTPPPPPYHCLCEKMEGSRAFPQRRLRNYQNYTSVQHQGQVITTIANSFSSLYTI